jgi:DNA-binding beta-propeller fold protein YncE
VIRKGTPKPMNKPATLSAKALAALGDDFPQLSFALNNPGAPNTIYIGADPTANGGLQFRVTTSTDATLTPGAPVPIDQAPNVSYSLLYLDLTPFNLSDAEFTNIVVSTDGGWATLPDLASRTICFAPDKPIPIAAGAQGVSVAITGLALANPPVGSTVQLSASYYNVDGITIDNFPSVTPLEVALLPPPDKDDNNLHDDISLSVQPTLVVCSKDPYRAVANTLTIQFSPGLQGRPVTAGEETVFEVHFLYAETPGSGALCTAAQGAAFVPARGTNAEQWTATLQKQAQEPYVSLKPPKGAPIVGSGVGAVVSFDVGNIITKLQPGATLMLVTYSGIPNYQDGSFQVVLTKVPHVDIVSLQVTPNPAQLEKKEGVAVVVDWVVRHGGTLKLTSSAGLDQDVTGTLSFPTTIKETTDFTLNADGIYGANLDNFATKSKTAVVTPHIEFTATILPDYSELQLTWNILGAVYAQLDGNSDLLEPQSHTPIPLGPTNPLPYSFTLKALDADRNELARKTVKRRWTLGDSVSIGGNAIYSILSASIAVSPDGERLYAVSGDWNNSSLSVFEPATLKPLGVIPAQLSRPMAIACAPDSSKIYAANSGSTGTATLTVIDATSHAVMPAILLPDLASGFSDPATLVANDKYVSVKARYGPVSLLVLDAHTYAKAWFEPGPDPGQGPISTGLALTEKRLYFTGDNVVKTLDSQTLALLHTASVPMIGPLGSQQLAAPDDSRTFLAEWGGVRTFPGSDWLNPTLLPSLDGRGCWGFAVTADGVQVFLLGIGHDNNVQLAELDSASGSYVRAGTFLAGVQMPCAIAVTPDNTRVFIGLVDANQRNAFISVLDASYA